MIAAERFRASNERIARHLGGDLAVTLRRMHTLNAQGAPALTLKVSGAHLAGVTAISLKATNLAGLLVTGLQFTIAGAAQVHTATGDVRAAGGVLASVPLAAPLAANAAADAVVTITRAYGDRTLYALRSASERGRTDEGRETDSRLYHLVADDGPAPIPGDQVLDGTYVGIIATAPEVNPGGLAVRWSVPVGSTP